MPFIDIVNIILIFNKPLVYVILETKCDPKKIQKTLMLLGFHEYLVMENQGFA